MPIDSVLKPFVSFFLFSVFMTLNSSETVFPSKTFFDSTSPKSSSLDFVTFLINTQKEAEADAWLKSHGFNPGNISGPGLALYAQLHTQ